MTCYKAQIEVTFVFVILQHDRRHKREYQVTSRIGAAAQSPMEALSPAAVSVVWRMCVWGKHTAQ